MPYAVFISHSVGDVEMPIVNEMSARFSGAGVQPFVAHYYRDLGNPVSAKVEAAISGSDAVVVLWTKAGSKAAWVNQEVGYALGRERPVFALVEKGVDVEGMLHGREYARFDPSNPSADLGQMAQYLAYVKSQKELAEANAGWAKEHADTVQMELFFGVVFVCMIIVIIALAARE